MKLVVIGLGSMGRRRIRLIRKIYEDIEIVGVDTNEERRKKCFKEEKINTFSSLSDAIKKIDLEYAFICTSPLTHSILISECLGIGLHVFTEINLVDDGYEENIAMSEKMKRVLFLSSTCLYSEEIKKIKSLTQKAECLLNYTYHVGQYLPDWHPWENYKDFFVDNKKSNACREIFAIELPWLSDVFGEIVKVDAVKSKMSSLDIDYADNYIVIVQHITGHKGSFVVDILSRKAVRNLDVFGETTYIHWDGTPTGLTVFDIKEKKEKNIIIYDNYVTEKDYINEIISFFEAVKEEKEPPYSFKKDKKILEIIDRIEAE